MASDLWVKQGIYDPTKQFEFTNITNDDFTFTWNGNPITIKAGEKVKLPHHLAVMATTRLVDKIITGEVKEEEDKMKKELRDPYYKSPRGISLAVPAARKVYEDKIVKELDPIKDTDTQMQVIRLQKKEELLKDLRQENSPKIESGSQIGLTDIKEFEGVNLPSAQ